MLYVYLYDYCYNNEIKNTQLINFLISNLTTMSETESFIYCISTTAWYAINRNRSYYILTDSRLYVNRKVRRSNTTANQFQAATSSGDVVVASDQANLTIHKVGVR